MGTLTVCITVGFFSCQIYLTSNENLITGFEQFFLLCTLMTVTEAQNVGNSDTFGPLHGYSQIRGTVYEDKKGIILITNHQVLFYQFQ